MKWLIPLCALILAAAANTVGFNYKKSQVCAGIYSKDDWGGGHQPSVELQINLYENKKFKEGEEPRPIPDIDVLYIIFEYRDLEHIGIEVDGKRHYLCNKDMIEKGVCTEEQKGNFMYQGGNHTLTIMTGQLNHLGKANLEYNVSRTGYYCVSTVLIYQRKYSGEVLFQNAFGYLSASEVPKLPAYGIMSILYLVALALFGFQFFKKRKQNQILPLQRYLLAMLGFLTFDSIVEWLYYDLLNNTRKTTSGFNIFYMIFLLLLNAIKISGTFYILLLIAMGYGVVVPKLPKKIMFRCKILAGANFVALMVYLIGTYYSGSIMSISRTNDIEDNNLGGIWGLLAYIPIAITMTIYYFFILVSIRNTIKGLQEQRQVIKLHLYENLFRIVFFLVVLTFAGLVLSLFIFLLMLSTELMEEHWKGTFFIYDFWPSVVFFIVFLGVAWLWRPTETSYMLAISQQLAADDPEEDENGNYQRGHEFELDDLSLMSHSDNEAGGDANRNLRNDLLDLPHDQAPAHKKTEEENPFEDAATLGTLAPLELSSTRRSNDNTLFELGDDDSDHEDDRLNEDANEDDRLTDTNDKKEHPRKDE